MIFGDNRSLEGRVSKRMVSGASSFVLAAFCVMIGIGSSAQLVSDMYTSALSFDGLVRTVFITPPQIYQRIMLMFPSPVSVEGASVSIMLSLFTVVFFAQVHRSGAWLISESGRDQRTPVIRFLYMIVTNRINWSDINAQKFSFWAMGMAFGLGDTILDTIVKAIIPEGAVGPQRLGHYITTFVILVVTNMIMSELGVVAGVVWTWHFVVIAMSDMKDAAQQRAQGLSLPKRPGRSRPRGSQRPQQDQVSGDRQPRIGTQPTFDLNQYQTGRSRQSVRGHAHEHIPGITDQDA